MDESWEKWISSLEMGGDNSCGEDNSNMNTLEGEPSSFSFENAIDNDLSSNSTMQYCNNNNNVVNVDSGNTLISMGHSNLSCDEAISFDLDDDHDINNKMLKRNNSSNSIISQEDATLHNFTPSQSTFILSFENSTVEPATHNSSMNKGKQGRKNVRHRSSPSEIQCHIMAERRRRQVLTERFIALSATIPGLKKTDKAYILREAINYVKQLQEQVKDLENQNKRKKEDSIIFMKKSQACSNEETKISCEENSNNSGHEFKKAQQLPKVEARVLEKEILIGIHCEKQKDIVLRLMVLLQNLHLSPASSSVLPFGTSTLKVTIIAQMEEKYCMSVNDLVQTLRQSMAVLHVDKAGPWPALE